MYYTYILKNIKQHEAIYKGYTKDLKLRLEQHNGQEDKRYSKTYSPWKLETYIVFSSKIEVKGFEEYLKSSSGHAFMKKRLISNSFRVALERFNNGRKKLVSET